MKETIINKRTLEVIFNDQKTEIDKTRKRELNGLLLANKQTKCENLLLLTDHEYTDIEKDGHHISIRPVYEWSADN